jgi:hypothetical protein
MPRRGSACNACQRAFEPGDAIQACLCESPGGYERRDYCLECEPANDPPPIGLWKTRRPKPVTAKTLNFDREAIHGFFERLEDAQTPEQRQLRFVLALLLWRKKVLKFERSEDGEDGEVWHFVMPRTGATHAVPRPDLGEDELERLGGQLEVLLAGEAGAADPIEPTPNEDQSDV